MRPERRGRAERLYRCDALVRLPDHLHAIWTRPAGDSNHSSRWRLIKTRFVREAALFAPRSLSQAAKKESGIWQRWFWEHCIRNDAGLTLHLRFCWENPVRHGLVVRGMEKPERTGAVAEGAFGEHGRRWVRATIQREGGNPHKRLLMA